MQTLRQDCKHHQAETALTRCTDKTYSCSPTSDSFLPTNLAPHVCLAQLADCVDQLGISLGKHRCHRSARKGPYRGDRRKQGRTIPVIVTDRSQPRILHPLCMQTHDTVRPLTDKCDTVCAISYPIKKNYDCLDEIIPIVTSIINKSLSSGIVSQCFKHAQSRSVCVCTHFTTGPRCTQAAEPPSSYHPGVPTVTGSRV